MDIAVNGKYFLEPGNDFTRRRVNRIMNDILKRVPEWTDFSDLYLRNKVKAVECCQELLNKLADALRRDFRLKFKIWSLVGEKLKIYLTSSEFKMRVGNKVPEGKHDRLVRYQHTAVAKRTIFAHHTY